MNCSHCGNDSYASRYIRQVNYEKIFRQFFRRILWATCLASSWHWCAPCTIFPVLWWGCFSSFFERKTRCKFDFCSGINYNTFGIVEHITSRCPSVKDSPLCQKLRKHGNWRSATVYFGGRTDEYDKIVKYVRTKFYNFFQGEIIGLWNFIL